MTHYIMFTALLLLLTLLPSSATKQITLPGGGKTELLPGPANSTIYNSWLKEMLNWRTTTRTKLNISQNATSTIAATFPTVVKWATETIVQPQVHVYDRYIYNDTSGKFTVDAYLKDVTERYGGIDSVLLWAGYPNLGIDSRNQFDLLRLADTKIVAQQFRDRGIHVLIGYNPWDSATRREPYDDATALAKNLPEMNVEGFNGDTMPAIPKQFWEATVKEHETTGTAPLIFEPEGGGYGIEFDLPALGSFNWDVAGWGYMNDVQYFPSGLHQYSKIPGVDRSKWLTLDGLRLTHVCDRWNKQRSDAILLAFFNGIGYESWENIWGIWNQINDRDAELLRRSATILRWTSQNNLTRGYAIDGWRPHSIDISSKTLGSIFTSRFNHAVVKGASLWTIVNVGNVKLCDIQWTAVGESGIMYDLYTGIEVTISTLCMEGRSVKALLYVPNKLAFPTLSVLLATMATMTTDKPLSSYNSKWKFLKQELLPKGVQHKDVQNVQNVPHQHPKTTLATTCPKGQHLCNSCPRYCNPPRNFCVTDSQQCPMSSSEATTKAMQILIPRVKKYMYNAGGVEIEGDCDQAKDTHNICCKGKCNIFLNKNVTGHENCQCAFPSNGGTAGQRGVDVQFPWESFDVDWKGPRRNHNKSMDIGPFLMDKYPVTREEYALYLKQTKYTPVDLRQYLIGWNLENNTWRYPKGTGRFPVTSISLSEARMYCKAVGKRLPQTYEWQLAAQGTDGRLYPWGNSKNQSNYPVAEHPINNTSKSWSGPKNVDHYQGNGDSMYGVSDLVGNVWQWTGSEFADLHTRRVIVRGSSSYVPYMANVYPAPKMLASWYFNPALELDKHAIWLLMKNSYDRATTVGFRCVEDVKGGAPGPYYYR